MRGAGYILSGAAGMPLNVINSKNYYKEHQSRIDRTSIINGKVSYDLDRNKMLNDVMELGRESFTGTLKGLYAITQNDYESFKKVEEEDFARANEYKNRINEELGNETSGFQSFVAGIPIHMLRQFVDVRQYPTLLAGNYIGGAIGAKVANAVGASSKVGLVTGKALGNAVENTIQGVGDRLITDGELDWLGITTDFFSGAGFSLAGSALKGDIKFKSSPEVKAKVKAEADQATNNFKAKAVDIGENNAKVEDANVISEGVSVIADMKGKYINPEQIKNNSITINGATLQTAKDKYLPKVIDFIVKNKSVEGINTIEEFLTATSDKAKMGEIYKVIKEVAKQDNIMPTTQEAFAWFSEFLDKERIKVIDVDKSKLEKEALKALNERLGYIPVFRDVHTIEPDYNFVETNLDRKSFTAVTKKAKGKKLSDKNIISKAKKDLNIPEKTIVKATKNGDEISVEWEENGYKMFSTVTDVDGKYRGDIYKSKIDIPQKTKGKGKIKSRPEPELLKAKPVPADFVPTNMMEDIFGAYNLELKKAKNYNIVKDIVAKRFGLYTAIDSKTPMSVIGNINKNLIENVGKILQDRHGFLYLEDAVDYFKEMYGIDFDFEITDKLGSTFGKTEKIFDADTLTTKYKIYISDKISDDAKFGTLNHEIKHLEDFMNNPDFKSKPVYPISKKRATNVLEYLNQITDKHFSGIEGNYELQYIIANELDNLVHNGKIDKTMVTSYNLDIPMDDELSELGLNFIEDTVENTKGMDGVQRISELKRRADNYFKQRKTLKHIFSKTQDPKALPHLLKEWVMTNITRPFKKVAEQVESTFLKSFEIEIDGDIYNGDKFIEWYKSNGGDFMDYLLGEKDVPEKIAKYTPQIEKVRDSILELVDGLTKDGLITREQALYSVLYNEREIVENLLTPEEKASFMDRYGQFDFDRFEAGEKEYDNIVLNKEGEPTEISKRIKNVRDRFAEKNYKLFPNAIKSLEVLLSQDKLDIVSITRRLPEVRKCMTRSEFINFIKSNNLIEIPEVKTFLENNVGLFAELNDNKIAENILKSQKDNARRFFTMDMASHKGTYNNPNFGTYAHKLSRFNYFTEQGIILSDDLKTLVKRNRGRQETAMGHLLKDVSSAYAIKEVFPGVGFNDFSKMLSDVQNSFPSRNTKTYIKDIERMIDGEIGEKLGRVTKAPRTKLDDWIDIFLKISNTVNLTGIKAFKELFYETPGMARDSVLKFMGPGTLQTYKEILRAMAIIKRGGDELMKINEALGRGWLDEMPAGYYNIIMDELDDPFGAKRVRVMESGDAINKLYYKLGRGVDKLNWYGTTQRFLKLAAYFNGSTILDNTLANETLEEAMEKGTSTFKRLVRNLDITETDFELMKGIKDLPTFKEQRVFSKMEFSDSLTPEKLSQVLGKELTEEEFEILRKDIADKAYNMYNDIVSNISPTEPEGVGRSLIGTQTDPINRNFLKLTTNFKSSIQIGWGRMIGSYKYANINDAGKYDWGNIAHQKRLLRHMVEVGSVFAITATAFDLDFYEDPEGEIERRIDELVDNPASALWYAMQDYFNVWGATTGASSIRQPMSAINKLTKGDYAGAGESTAKFFLGTQNVNMLKNMYELTQ